MQQPRIKIYHYAKPLHWNYIVAGEPHLGLAPGLEPQISIGANDPEARRTKAIFGLLKPEPAEWMQNPHFRHAWPDLKRTVGGMLLEARVDLDDKNVFVGDGGHIETVCYPDEATDGIPTKYLHDTVSAGERAYMESRVSLADYVRNVATLGFSLPEVTITRHVSLDRVTISQQQPLLEARLEKYPASGRIHQDLVADINCLDELQPWYRAYLEKQEREQRDRGTISRERG